MVGACYRNCGIGNATTAAAYNIDRSFHTRVRVGLAVSFRGGTGMRYSAHGTPYRPRGGNAGLRFKRVRFRTYEMMRVRVR